MRIKQEVHAKVGYAISGTTVIWSTRLQLHLMSALHAAPALIRCIFNILSKIPLLFWWTQVHCSCTVLDVARCYLGPVHLKRICVELSTEVKWILATSKISTQIFEEIWRNCGRYHKRSHSKGLIKSLEQTGLGPPKHQRLAQGSLP